MKAFSGKFVLRIDPLLHERCRANAEAQNISLNQYLVNLVSLGQNGGPESIAESSLTAPLRDLFRDQLLGIVVFGSTVRGEQRASSDIDLLIVLGESRAIDRSLYRIWDDKIAPKLGPKYSPQFSHLPGVNQPSSLWLEVALEGEILYDQATLPVKSAIRRIREDVASGLYIRKLSHGHPYWVRTEIKSAE